MTKPSGQATPRRILVVDDDEHTRNLLADLCEASGYEVTHAEDGEETMKEIRGNRPDLVLLDLMMPRKDGFSVLREIRQTPELRDLAVIILTANGDMDGKIRGMELGADDYVTKPFKLVELQTRISSALTVHDYRRKLLAAEEELAQLRAVDPLTGAGTYSQLKASLDAELARARRYGRPTAALLFGVEDYQNLRFDLGRDKCDEYIATIVRNLREGLRGADRVFRMDVDEFVVLLPETDLPGAKIAADRLHAIATATAASGRDASSIKAKVRIGGAVFPSERVRSSEDLLREANRVYRALRNTGDKSVFDV